MYLMLIIIIIILLISTLVGEKNKSYPFNKILPKQDFCKIIQFTYYKYLILFNII